MKAATMKKPKSKKKEKRTKRQVAHKNLPPLDILQRYTINESADYLRVSRAYVCKLIKKGSLETIEEGSHRFVTGSAIEARCTIDKTG